MSENIIKFKGYFESLQRYASDIESYKQFSNDKRISYSEKKLLQSHLHIRSNKNNEVISLIEDVDYSEPFFKAQKELLLGLAYNNLGQCKKAINHFDESITIYESIDEKDFIVWPLTNIIFAYENINSFSSTNKFLLKLESIETTNPIINFHKLRCFSSQAYYQKNYEKALVFINKAIECLPPDSKHYEAFVIIDRFNIYFALQNYVKCERLIKKSQNYRIFKNSDNYKYLKPLIENLLHNKPIYIYKGDLSDGSLLESQIILLKNLSVGEIMEAEEIWEMLSNKYPKTYQEDFTYCGQVNIFSTILKKYLPSNEQGVDHSIILNLTGSSKDRLVFILKNYSGKFDKYQMIKFLWPDEECDVKLEKRLNTLMSKVRKQYKIQIKKEMGKYKICA